MQMINIPNTVPIAPHVAYKTVENTPYCWVFYPYHSEEDELREIHQFATDLADFFYERCAVGTIYKNQSEIDFLGSPILENRQGPFSSQNLQGLFSSQIFLMLTMLYVYDSLFFFQLPLYVFYVLSLELLFLIVALFLALYVFFLSIHLINQLFV